jgi:segregation and condensation protein A
MSEEQKTSDDQKTSPAQNESPEVESTAVESPALVPAAETSHAAPAEAAPEKPVAKRNKAKDAESASPFSVTVGQVYDGPLDLLLDLIRKQDIDIYDIPIAKITGQFLGYVEHLKATDVDSAGEFIYMAALLIHIKSKMLLPRSPVEVAEGEAEDPRRELVERLLEHERFKNAAQMLAQRQQIEEATWTNPAIREFRNAEGTEQEIAADTLDLARVFREIIDRAKSRPVLDVEEDSVTVGQMIDYVRRRLVMEDKPIALRRLLANAKSERALIAMFLALLELVRLQAILLRQDRNFSDIFIKKHEQFEQVLNERISQMRDDWS